MRAGGIAGIFIHLGGVFLMAIRHIIIVNPSWSIEDLSSETRGRLATQGLVTYTAVNVAESEQWILQPVGQESSQTYSDFSGLLSSFEKSAEAEVAIFGASSVNTAQYVHYWVGDNTVSHFEGLIRSNLRSPAEEGSYQTVPIGSESVPGHSAAGTGTAVTAPLLGEKPRPTSWCAWLSGCCGKKQAESVVVPE